MTPQEYQDRAMAKEADQELLKEWVYQQGVEATRIENGLRGLMDEVGELAGAVKGWLEYQRIPNKENILEECGDALWRITQILKGCGYTLDQAMESNLAKLEKVRYKDTICSKETAGEENRNRQLEAKTLVNAVLNIKDK